VHATQAVDDMSGLDDGGGDDGTVEGVDGAGPRSDQDERVVARRPRSIGTPGFWYTGSCSSRGSGSRVPQSVLTKIVSPSTLPSLFL
jgi:hypothetical protein